MFPIGRMAKQDEPIYNAPWDPTVPNSLIMLEALAHVSMKVIDEREKHYFAEYPLCAPMPLPYTGMAECAEKALGKKVKVVKHSFEYRARKMTDIVLGKDPNAKSVDGAERLILWYERCGLNGNPNVVRALLGHEPKTIDQWMAKGVEAAREY